MIAKLVFRNEIRLCSGIESFPHLLKQIRTLFPSAPTNPKLHYVDFEGDKITISSNSDIECLKTYANGKVIKVEIIQGEAKEVTSQKEDIEEF